MPVRLKVTSETGILVLRDRGVSIPTGGDPAALRALRGVAERGDAFFLDCEDVGSPTLALRLALYVDEATSDLPAHRFESFGGAFLLALPSGRLRVGDSQELDVPPGDYAVHVFREAVVDAAAIREEEKGVLPESEWRFRHLVERLAMLGRVALLGLAIVLLVFKWSRISLVTTLAFAVLAAPVYFLGRSTRFRRGEEALREFNLSFPQYAIQLCPVPDRSGLCGGHLTI